MKILLQKNHNPNLGFLTLLRRVGWHAPFIIVNIIKPFKKTKMRLMIIINIDLRTKYNAQALYFVLKLKHLLFALLQMTTIVSLILQLISLTCTAAKKWFHKCYSYSQLMYAL